MQSLERLWRDHRRALIAVLIVLLGGGGSVALVVDEDGDGTPDHTIPAKSPLAEAAAEVDMTLSQAREAVEEGDPRKEPGDTDAFAEAQPELAGSEVPGCTPRILSVNFSTRNGARPAWLTWHYAVIRNTPGMADLDLLHRIFAADARDASSHFGLDAEGNCIQMVPIAAKAWTAVNANPFSVSVEIIAFGDEKELCPRACLEQARRIARHVKAKTGIPVRRGSVSSFNLCVPGRSGQIHHHDHRSCGGGHVDVTPFSIDRFVKQLADDGRTLSDIELKIVRSIRHPKGTGHSRRFWCRRGWTQASRLGRLAAKSNKHDRRARQKILGRVVTKSCRTT